MSASLAIRAKWALVEEAGETKIVRDRWVVVEGDRIAAIAAERPGGAAQVVDHPGLLVLPGLIDLHNHVFTEALIRGRSEDLAAETYITTLVFGLLMPVGQRAMQHLSPAECEAVAEFGLMQLMKSGVTTLMEPFRAGLTGPFVAAARRAGLRFYAAPYLFSTPDLDVGADGKPSFAGGGGAAEAAAIEEWRRLHAEFDGEAEGRIRVVLSPHGTDTCGADLLRAVRRLADEHRCLATIHVSQSESEVAASRERYGRTPAEYLDWVGLLGPDVLLAHCVYAPDGDLDIIKRTDTTIINCPRSFSRGGIPASFARFHGRGIRTVVATDGYILDIIGELQAAGLVAKLTARDSGVATARQLVGAVTDVAAAALRRTDIGRLAPGAKADIVAIDLGGAHHVPVSDPLKALIWRGQASDVWASVVDGQLVVDEGSYLAGDEAAIAARAAAIIEKVARLGETSGILDRAK